MIEYLENLGLLLLCMGIGGVMVCVMALIIFLCIELSKKIGPEWSSVLFFYVPILLGVAALMTWT